MLHPLLSSVRRGLLLLCVGLLLITGVFGVSAQEATYTAPDGAYTIPVPANTTNESTDEYALFTTADGSSIYIVSVATTNAEDEAAAATAAIALVDPEQTLEAQQLNDAITPKGVWKQYVYVNADGSGELAVAVVRAEGDAYYVYYIISPDQSALVAATPALNEMLIGMEFVGALDLTGAEPLAFDDVMAADFESYVEQALEDYNVTGASVAIVQNGEVVYSNGFGVRELGGEPVDADTLFMIGSTTKSMTTFLLGTLVDEGVLDWDTPVTEILPEFALSDPEVTEQIRVRDLVNNSSGVPRYDLVLLLKYMTPEEMIESLANIPLVSEPGEAFNYSNQMVATGGFVAALAAGATYGEDIMEVYNDLLETRLFDPLGMERSTISVDEAVADPNHALPYTHNYETGELEPVSLNAERFAEPLAPAGAVWSSANEMAKYLQMQLAVGTTADGEQLISTENLLETQLPGLAMGEGSRYAMGWYVASYNGLPVIMHGGATTGFTADFMFIRDADFGIVVLSNTSGAANFLAAVGAYAAELIYDLDHDSIELYAAAHEQTQAIFEQIMAQFPEGQSVDADTVEPYLGDYELSVNLTLNDEGQLIATSDFASGEILVTENEGEYIGGDGDLEGIMLTFETDEDGTVTLTLSNPLDPTQDVTVRKLD